MGIIHNSTSVGGNWSTRATKQRDAVRIHAKVTDCVDIAKCHGQRVRCSESTNCDIAKSCQLVVLTESEVIRVELNITKSNNRCHRCRCIQSTGGITNHRSGTGIGDTHVTAIQCHNFRGNHLTILRKGDCVSDIVAAVNSEFHEFVPNAVANIAPESDVAGCSQRQTLTAIDANNRAIDRDIASSRSKGDKWRIDFNRVCNMNRGLRDIRRHCCCISRTIDRQTARASDLVVNIDMTSAAGQEVHGDIVIVFPIGCDRDRSSISQRSKLNIGRAVLDRGPHG